MECLTRSSKILIDEFRVSGLGGFNYNDCVSRRMISFSNCSRRVFYPFLSSVNCQSVLPPVFATPHSQASKVAVDGEDQLRTVRVKFQLQKACGFGDHFLMVGDDPLLGSWDPENAVTMEWSDGHIWTAEVDMPVEKTIQFKFVLKQSTGNVIWQPGPDRIFKAWTTSKTITLVEDWENCELQTIVEDGVPGHDEELLLKTGVKSLQQANKNQLSENITYSEDSTFNILKVGASATEESSYSEKESSIRMMMAHNIIGDHKTSLIEGLEDEVILADPVLVPGLAPPVSCSSSEGSSLENLDKNSDLNGSIRSPDSNDQTALESCSNLKGESEEVKLQLQEENLKPEREEPDSGLKQGSSRFESEEKQKNDVTPQREEKTKMKLSNEIEFTDPFLEKVERQRDTALQETYSVFQNDMLWGRKTMQNLLASFRLFLYQHQWY